MKKSLLIFAAAALVALIPFASAQNYVQKGAPIVQQRLTPDEFPWAKSVPNRPGSGLQPGIETIYLVGDGTKPALYSMVFRVAAHTAIEPHSHPDSRSCFVLSGGPWYFAYGTVRDESKLKALPPGSSYTEPANAVHFAGTKDQGAVVECTSVGPTGTTPYKAAK